MQEQLPGRPKATRGHKFKRVMWKAADQLSSVGGLRRWMPSSIS